MGQDVLFPFAALRVHDGELAALADDELDAVTVGDGLYPVEDDPAGVERLELVLFDGAGGRTADVEGTHGELGARLADGLGRDDAHGLADVDQMAAGQVAPVAERADAAFGLAGQRRTHHDGGHAVLFQDLGLTFVDEGVFRQEHHVRVFGVIDRVEEHTPDGPFGERRLDVAAVLEVGELHAVHRAAVMLGDDDVLHHVHETAGQVTGVGRLEGGVGQTLACAVGGGEVLQHRQALAERGRDGRFNDFPGRLGHEAAHAGELAHLVLVASSAGVGHHEDGVEALVLFLTAGLGVGQDIVGDLLGHFRGNILRGLGPDVDDLVVLFGTGDDAVPVLAFDVVHLGLGGGQDILFAGRDGEVLHADGHAGAGGELVPHVLEAVAEDDRGLDAALAVGGAHEAGDVLLGEDEVHMLEAQFGGQDVAHQYAAGAWCRRSCRRACARRMRACRETAPAS